MLGPPFRLDMPDDVWELRIANCEMSANNLKKIGLGRALAKWVLVMSFIYPDPLSQGKLDELFPPNRPRIHDNTFEIGLVLAGTVSAGAYSAGVLDYFIEALDSWTRAKEQGRAEAPMHNVVISTIARVSGGTINGAILAGAAGWSFKHGPDGGNPFYSAWARGVGLTELLSAQVEPGVDGFTSLFNCNAIEKQTAAAIAYQGTPLGQENSPAQRSYLADPLRLHAWAAKRI